MTDLELQAFTDEVGQIVLRIESGQIPRISYAEVISSLIGFAAQFRVLENAAPGFPPIISTQMQQVVAQLLALPGREDRVKVVH